MTTRDEVLAMAEQAGIHRRSHPEGTREMWCWEDALERFHALAVAPYVERLKYFEAITTGAQHKAVDEAIDRARSAK